MERLTVIEILHHYPEFTGIHEACEALPDMADDDFTVLVESIRKSGLAHSLLADHAGRLVDGRHRLIACYMTGQEIRVKRLRDGADVWDWVSINNLAHRHLTVGQKAMFGQRRLEAEKEKAKERQKLSQGQGKKGQATLPDLKPEDKGQSRDKVAQSVGVGSRAIDKAATITEHRPDLAEKVKQGQLDLEPAYREARKTEKQKATQPSEPEPQKQRGPAATLPVISTTPKARIVTVDGKVSEIDAPKTVRFNQTNDNIDWADWSWNPVTGCEHGCLFCYAREIASAEKMKPYYPFGFAPAFHEYRLDAPKNTSCPDTKADPRKGRVFVCSMADLFGKWVPDEWISKVFAACLESPSWEYLFLTKYPARYAKLPRLIKAWYGASVIKQADVSRVEKAMGNLAVGVNCVRWVSLEPMQEPIRFDDLSWCDLMVIGGQTATTQPEEGYIPEFAPEFDWVVDVVNQCRDAGVPYYLKANLFLDRPGMRAPKSLPRS